MSITQDASRPVRVRFAPAPTGFLHIGSLKMAFFNWLFARRHNGTYIVRVEDTDYDRCRPEYTEAIFRTLAWCGIESDEPVVYQSQRTDVYCREIERLVASGAAYRCYCTQEEMQSRVRKLAADGHEYFVYDGFCRTRVDEPQAPFVVRLAVPRDREAVVVHDICRGELRFPISAIDDFVLVRSDGSPMYNCTVVIDDALMHISHVIRGDDHIINTPRQALLYEALGFPMPMFAHVPLILGKDGAKLSKRDAATAVDAYREMGFLPDALCNYLVRLGWSDGDAEIISRQDLMTRFSLEAVGRKGAHFDYAKLVWMNGEYIKHASSADVLMRIHDDLDATLQQSLQEIFSEQALATAVKAYQQRSKTLVELRDQLVLLVTGGQGESPILVPAQRDAIRALMSTYEAHSQQGVVDEPMITAWAKEIVVRHALSFAELAMPLRWALAGSTQAPSLGLLMTLFDMPTLQSRVARLGAHT